MAESRKRKRFTAFDGRATTLLKQTSQLATLCGSPGCIVIYDPNDVTRPWRLWPENEADFRSAIQIYKKSKKIRPHTAQKSKPSRRRKKPTVDNFGSSTSSLSRGSTSTDLSGVNEFLTSKLTPMWMDPTTGQAGFDYGNVSTPTTTSEQSDSVLAGKEGALVGSEAEKALTVDVEFHSLIATPSSAADTINADADHVGMHTIATAGELSDDIFDLDELLNMSDDEWISYCNSQQ